MADKLHSNCSSWHRFDICCFHSFQFLDLIKFVFLLLSFVFFLLILSLWLSNSIQTDSLVGAVIRNVTCHHCPSSERVSGSDQRTPFLKGVIAVSFESCSGGEVAVEAEMVMNGGMHGGKFL